MTQVINLYGGPGTGKSTTAAHLFALMKQSGLNVELVTEYAKDKVWERSYDVLGNQVYILAKQYHRFYRLLNQTDYIVTDAALLLNLYYARNYGQNLLSLVKELYDSMDNVDIFLRRVKPYTSVGRTQNEEQAREIDEFLEKSLTNHKVPFIVVDGDKNAAGKIFKMVGPAYIGL